MSLLSLSEASTQPRTSPLKFDHFVEKFGVKYVIVSFNLVEGRGRPALERERHPFELPGVGELREGALPRLLVPFEQRRRGLAQRRRRKRGGGALGGDEAGVAIQLRAELFEGLAAENRRQRVC